MILRLQPRCVHLYSIPSFDLIGSIRVKSKGFRNAVTCEHEEYRSVPGPLQARRPKLERAVGMIRY